MTPVSIHDPQSPGWRPRTRTWPQPVFRRLSPSGPPMPRHARLLRTVDQSYQPLASRTPRGLTIPQSPPCGGRLLRASATKPFAFVWTLSLRVPAGMTRYGATQSRQRARLFAFPPGRRWLRVHWCCQRNPSRPVFAAPTLAGSRGSSGPRWSVRLVTLFPSLTPGSARSTRRPTPRTTERTLGDFQAGWFQVVVTRLRTSPCRALRPTLPSQEDRPRLRLFPILSLSPVAPLLTALPDDRRAILAP